MSAIDINLPAVLAEINKIRASVGRKPRKGIAKGRRCGGPECPIARSVGTGASVGVSYMQATDDGERFKIPAILYDFVWRFDRGELPQFERKGGK